MPNVWASIFHQYLLENIPENGWSVGNRVKLLRLLPCLSSGALRISHNPGRETVTIGFFPLEVLPRQTSLILIVEPILLLKDT